MKRVYIAGPYSKGDVVVNIRKAIEAAQVLRNYGYVPFVPHLAYGWHMVYPRDDADWLAYDLAWLDVCDALVRLDGESPGADCEVVRAKSKGIPVYYSVSGFLETASSEGIS